MKKIRAYFQQISINEIYTPLLFLLIAFLGFGLQAKRLGFYQDDWPYVFYAFNKGISSLKEALFYDSRPNAAWLYIGLFKLLGFKPLSWQIAALVTRWLTATLLWYVLKIIWPENSRQVTFTIVLFVIHPFFLIQSAAVNSMLYWAGFLFFATSILIMARAATLEKFPIFATCIAVFLEGVHLFTSEYFVGVTLIRPFILYWLLSKQNLDFKKLSTKILGYWIPYLLALGAYLAWRLFLFIPPPGGDRNTPQVLYALIKTPLQAITSFIQTAFQDSSIVIITSWYKTFTPNFFDLTSAINRANLVLAFASFVLIVFFLNKINKNRSDQETRTWLASPLILGMLIVFLSLAPIWIIGQDISTHVNQFAASRFGIVTTLGASLILAVLFENFIGNDKKKVIAIALCATMAINMHISNESAFAYSWEKQENLYRQLLWRAPEIKPGTAIVTDEEVLGFMGHYAVAFGVTTAYQLGDIQTPPYWYFPFYYTNPDTITFLGGIPLEEGRLSMKFKGSSNQYLLLSYNPDRNRCLWVLQPQDVNLLLVSGDMRTVSLRSDINLIKNDGKHEKSLPESIFGPQNDTDHWCYYFQKADLARQYNQWDEIINLSNAAKSKGIRGENGFEFIPFIEASAHTNDWEQVETLTKSARRITSGLEPSLCSMLDRISQTTPATTPRDETIHNLQEYLTCQNYQ